MKTTDLIPLILYQLSNSDKYGYEIVKEIEDASNGIISIKQPTLYSLLKKLEHGKFISSYWQDSEIGGKRHYYKLTDNGKAQLDTYPAYEHIIKEICNETGDEGADTTNAQPIVSEEVKKEDVSPDDLAPVQDLDVMPPKDNIVENNSSVADTHNNEEKVVVTPIKIDLTSPIVSTVSESDTDDEKGLFSNIQQPEQIQSKNSTFGSIFDAIQPAEDYSPIEATTSEVSNHSAQELSESDHNIIDNPQQNIEQHVSVVTEFAPTSPSPQNKLYSKLQPTDMMQSQPENDKSDEMVGNELKPVECVNEISYLEYVNLATDEQSLSRKRSINKRIQKMALTCFTLLAVLICSLILVCKHSFSSMYYATIIIAGLVLIFYPIILLRNVSKIRLKYCSTPFKYFVLRDLFVKLSIFLLLVVSILAYNISVADNIKSIFDIANCANFMATLMLSSVIMLDFVYNTLFFKKYK